MAQFEIHSQLSKIGQTFSVASGYTRLMAAEMRILTTEPDGDDGLIVTFSDGTTGAYVVEELLELRPVRERAKTKKDSPHKGEGKIKV